LPGEGSRSFRSRGYLIKILEPDPVVDREGCSTFAPGGKLLRTGDIIRFAELGDLLERLGREGPGFAYEATSPRLSAIGCFQRGGLITSEDLANYKVIDRTPAHASLPRQATSSPTLRRRRAGS
jgi:gamma-glutamyltranspeptidase